MKYVNLQIQDAQQIPNRINPLMHTIIKISKNIDKERILKATYYIKGTSITISTNLSSETLE